MTMPPAEVVFDHYARFLGKPRNREVYRATGFGESVQVLEFDNVFSGCTTVATLGLGRLVSQYSDDSIEIVMVVDDEVRAAERLLVDTLFGALQNKFPVREGISIGGPGGVFGGKTQSDQKTAFYFTEPVPFPPEFRSLDSQARLLIALPITANEHAFVKMHGGGAFEERLQEERVDPFEIHRQSVCTVPRPGNTVSD